MFKLIDFRNNGSLPMELAERMSSMQSIIGKEYTEYIGGLADLNNITGLGWLVNVTCRNPYQTKIFDRLCQLALLDDCLNKREEFVSVVVDNYGMFVAVNNLCDKYGVLVDVVYESGSETKGVIATVRKALILIYLSFISLIAARFFPRNRPASQAPLIYIDTFASKGSFDRDGKFIDRFYTGMMEYLQDDLKDRVWYAPVVLSCLSYSDLRDFFKKCRMSGAQFLIMEQWLTFIDYLYAFYYSLILPQGIRHKPLFRGVDISELISSEVNKDGLSYGLFVAVLRYRFIFRLKKNGIKIEKVIDWNENQVIDRALNLAVREYYSSVKVVGYQGFVVSDYYVSHEPACYEREAGTVPDLLYVVSPYLLDRKRKYCSEQKVSIAPAFRFQELIHYEHVVKDKDIILLALPVQQEISRRIMNQCLRMNNLDGYRFVVKLHPTVNIDKFMNEVPEARNSQFQYVSDSLYSYFPQAALLISGDSSSCLEAVCSGVYVAIMGRVDGPTSSSLEGIVDSRYWRVCYTADSIQEMLYDADDRFSIDIKGILADVTRESVNSFLLDSAD